MSEATSITESPKCSNCRFWRIDNQEKGECHRSPPVLLGEVIIDAMVRYRVADAYEASRSVDASRWPVTAHDDWCGEYRMAKDNQQ